MKTKMVLSGQTTLFIERIESPLWWMLFSFFTKQLNVMIDIKRGTGFTFGYTNTKRSSCLVMGLMGFKFISKYIYKVTLHFTYHDSCIMWYCIMLHKMLFYYELTSIRADLSSSKNDLQVNNNSGSRDKGKNAQTRSYTTRNPWNISSFNDV